MARPRKTPRPRRYARTDSAVCDYYCPLTGHRRTATLGRWGSPAADAAFRRLLADLAANRAPAGAGRRGGAAPAALTLAGLCAAYLAHAGRYYRRADGAPTGEAATLGGALRFALGGGRSARPAAEFGLAELKAAREEMVSAGLARTTANAQAGRIARMFRWAANETPPLCPPSVAGELGTLVPLAKFRTQAREPRGVRPAPLKDVARALRAMSPVLRAMCRYEWRTGCRPQDVCGLTPEQITRPGPVWEVRPEFHKTAWRGQERVYYVPPRAQPELEKWLAGKKPKQLVFGRRGARAAGVYGQLVRRACLRAGVEPWTPNQLRHAAGTRWRRLYGAEVASVLLGHRALSTTEIYAERDCAGAARALLSRG